jgi:hypothetical protein
MSIELARERAAAGAAWLDEEEPGWRSRVDPEDLSMGNGDACIAGYVFADRVDPDYQENGYDWLQDRCGARWCRTHGFLDDATIEVTYTELKAVWLELLGVAA